MKIERYKRSETGFLSIDRDLETLYSEMAKSENLKKLLFYTNKNPLGLKNIDDSGIKVLYKTPIELASDGITLLKGGGTNKSKTEWFFTDSEEECKKKIKEGWRETSPTASLFSRNIKPIPRITIDRDVLNHVLINFPQIVENQNNPEFRDKIIAFDVVCHFDQWNCENFAIRPYRIAAELDLLFNKKRLSGIGKLHFLTCRQFALNSEFGGVTLLYAAINGEDDKVPNPTRPLEEEKYANYFISEEV